MENKDMEGSGPTESYSANRYWPPFVWGGDLTGGCIFLGS